MTENTLQWVQLVKLICLAGFATLYGFGGVRGKWKRRIVGPIMLTAAIVGISLWMKSFSLWLLAYAPLLYGALTKGYGGTDDTKVKIIKRTITGGLAAIASLPLAIASGAWLIFFLHIVVCILVSVVLGVWSATKSARAEETTIGFTYGFLPLMGMI